MHKNDNLDCLLAVITAQEAAQMWGLSRNAVSHACHRDVLRGRRAGQIWLVTVAAMLHYQHDRFWSHRIPEELGSPLGTALERTIARKREDD